MCCLVDYTESSLQYEVEFQNVLVVFHPSHKFAWITEANLAGQSCLSLLVSTLGRESYQLEPVLYLELVSINEVLLQEYPLWAL